jgi:hypothetical protein
MMRKLGLDVILCEERGFSTVSKVVLNGMKEGSSVGLLQ